MCIMLSPKSSSANNYFLLMDFLQSCDFYMVCKPSWDFSYQLAWWLLASFQHLYIFLLAAACFECYSSYFPIAERGSEYWIPIHPLHTRHGFQNSEAPFPPNPCPRLIITFYHPCCPSPHLFQLDSFFWEKSELCTNGGLSTDWCWGKWTFGSLVPISCLINPIKDRFCFLNHHNWKLWYTSQKYLAKPLILPLRVVKNLQY